MEFLRKLKGWLGVISTGIGWMLPPNIKAILQAVRIGLDFFIMAYKAAREAQANKLKREIAESAEKIQDPRITLEERLKLNAEMESHFKRFVSESGGN